MEIDMIQTAKSNVFASKYNNFRTEELFTVFEP